MIIVENKLIESEIYLPRQVRYNVEGKEVVLVLYNRATNERFNFSITDIPTDGYNYVVQIGKTVPGLFDNWIYIGGLIDGEYEYTLYLPSEECDAKKLSTGLIYIGQYKKAETKIYAPTLVYGTASV